MPKTSLGKAKVSLVTAIVVICLVATAVAVYWIQTEVYSDNSVPGSESSISNSGILSELARLNIKTTGQAKETSLTLPSSLNEPNWALKKTACEQGGYNLSAYAGKFVILTTYSITQKYGSEPLNVSVMSAANKIICVFKSVKEDSSMAPGIFSVKDSRVK